MPLTSPSISFNLIINLIIANLSDKSHAPQAGITPATQNTAQEMVASDVPAIPAPVEAEAMEEIPNQAHNALNDNPGAAQGTQKRVQRKRKSTKQVIYDCICENPITPDEVSAREGLQECKVAGCETRYVRVISSDTVGALLISCSSILNVWALSRLNGAISVNHASFRVTVEVNERENSSI